MKRSLISVRTGTALLAAAAVASLVCAGAPATAAENGNNGCVKNVIHLGGRHGWTHAAAEAERSYGADGKQAKHGNPGVPCWVSLPVFAVLGRLEVMVKEDVFLQVAVLRQGGDA